MLTKNRNPKVGIVVSSYERIEYLKEAVESALAQTYENTEIIIVDDCSGDGAVRQHLSSINDPRARYYINETNLGTTKNYDSGVRLLSKDVEYCLILDNDDRLDKNFVREAVKMFFEYPHAKVIHGRQVFTDAAGKITGHDNFFPLLEGAEDYLLLRCLGKREIRSSSLFFSLTRFKEIGGYPQFPSGMCTDSVFIFALAFDNALVYAEEAVVYTRIHEAAESISANNLFEKLSSIKEMQSYCLEVYKYNQNYNHREKNKALKFLKQYAGSLNSALLLRRYREILCDELDLSARKQIREIRDFCRKNRLFLPRILSLLIDCFCYWGIDLNRFIFYRILIKVADKINMIINAVLYKSFIFRQKIKRYLKTTYPLMYAHRQLTAALNCLFDRRSFYLTGVKYCHSCGCYSLFYWNKDYAKMLKGLIPSWGMDDVYAEQMILRENDFCANCAAVFRVRAHAKTVLKLLNLAGVSALTSFLKRKPGFSVYEVASYNLFRNERLKKFGNYTISEFRPEYKFGETIKGIRNENLEGLTFPDGSFDIMITSEVLEHVRDLSLALSEIRRVLKPGGSHIFTIPVNYALSEMRPRVIFGEDGLARYLYPLAFHGDDITDGILAQRDFGRDIVEIMSRHGFKCGEEKFYLNGRHITSVYIAKKA